MKENILVFPSSTINAVKFSQKNKNQYNFIGVSSDYMMTNIEFFDEWSYLPYINNSNFLELLLILLKKYNIKKIYATSTSVWYYFNEFIQNNLIDIIIINKSFFDSSLDYVNYFNVYSHQLYKNYKLRVMQNKVMSYSEFASVLHYYHQISGESGDNKFIALMQIASNAPQGDIVEIGSFQGKSAFSLVSLSKKYDIGNVLCIDSWSECIQHDSPKIIQKMGIDNANKIFYSFIINVTLFKGHINYIKKRSDDAYYNYKQSGTIYSEELGETQYQQKISILHIDGNHDYSCVYNDLKNYSEFLLDYSWIVLDDYLWAYGQGPKIVGDDFLRDNALNINNCFYTDSALFIQIKDVKKIVV